VQISNLEYNSAAVSNWKSTFFLWFISRQFCNRRSSL